MPNLVLEKGSQTFRFGLHEEKGVTNGKFITISFNGKEYYARYGETATPLVIEKEGRTYFIQYEPVEFVSYSWARNGRRNGMYAENVFLPKGKYSITYSHIDHSSSSSRPVYTNYKYEFTVNMSQETPINVRYKQVVNTHEIWVSVSGVYQGYKSSVFEEIKFTIERIGD